MPYTEESVIDTINAKDTGHIEIRVSNRVLKDGGIISTTYHRHVLTPGDDLSKQDPRVQAVAGANWTPENCKAATAAIVKLANDETATRNAAKAECDAACHAADAASVAAKNSAVVLEEANARLKLAQSVADSIAAAADAKAKAEQEAAAKLAVEASIKAAFDSAVAAAVAKERAEV